VREGTVTIRVLREILHLRWEHVAFGMLLLADSKTGKKGIVPNAPAIDVLANLSRLGAYVISGHSAGTEEEHPRHDLKRPWQAVANRAGPEGLRIHDLRHTRVGVGAGAGLGLPIIGKLLGHAQASTTARARRRHGQHLRGWTHYFASRRTVFKQLEQSAGVLASKLSSDRFVRDQWNELRINLAASGKQGRPDEPLHGDAQSGMGYRLRLNDCGAVISERKHPESH
jgi:hypothetical protein